MEESDFRERLTPEQYRVMRERGTEAPYTGRYWDADDFGVYRCAACGNELFSSTDKLESSDGWPIFARPINADCVSLEGEDDVCCAECGSHVGDIVAGDTPHIRVNSIALDFEEMELPELELPEEEDTEKEEEPPSKTPRNTLTQAAALVAVGAAMGAGTVFAVSGTALMCPAPINAVQGAAITESMSEEPTTSLPRTVPTQTSPIPPRTVGTTPASTPAPTATNTPGGTPAQTATTSTPGSTGTTPNSDPPATGTAPNSDASTGL